MTGSVTIKPTFLIACLMEVTAVKMYRQRECIFAVIALAKSLVILHSITAVHNFSVKLHFSVSEDQMSSAIQAGAVEKYRFRKVRKPVYEIVETFMDVVSETVCISVCLPNNAINSGVFNHTSKTCLCTLIGGFCRNIFAEKLDVLDEPPSNLTAELNMFVKMANVSVMLGCHSGKTFHFIISHARQVFL